MSMASCFHVDTRDRRNKMAVSWGKLAGGKLAYSPSCPAASHLAVCVATKHVAYYRALQFGDILVTTILYLLQQYRSSYLTLGTSSSTAATRAISATTATRAISATITTRAISANTATRAISATIATRAISATTATRAISATTATRAISATIATSFVKKKSDRRRPSETRGPIRQKWNSPRACGPRPVPMVAPGGHFFSNSGLAEYIYTTIGDACVCTIWPISARTTSFRHQTSRKFFSHSNFPIPYLWTAFCVPLSFVFYEKQ